MIDKIFSKSGESSVSIDLWVKAGSESTCVSGYDNWRECIIVRVKEDPVEGKANSKLIELFSDYVGVPEDHILISSGKKSKRKTITINGVDIDSTINKFKSLDKR